MVRAFLLSAFLCFLSSGSFGQIGFVHFQILDGDQGKLTPARLTVLKDGKPFELSVQSKLNVAVRNHVMYTSSGTGTLPLAPGTYELWFSKGMEYSIDVQTIVVVENEQYFLTAKLKMAIQTDGFVCGDMHLHTLTNSGHGDANLIERVISCAGEGLEWAVATDHNYITDYQPYLDSAGLNGVMTTTVGNEVSTSIGHFNIFPLQANENPVPTQTKDAKVLFDDIRAQSGERTVIQVNHPREVAPFFSLKGLDPFFGTVNNPSWSWDFDAFEVLNANRQTGWKIAPHSLQSVVRDWFNILNHNIRITGLGNSDSHTVIGNFAGVPRNYIKSSTDIPSEIDEKELAENILAQEVIVGCGIFPRIMVNGEDAMGKTYQTKNGELNLRLQVQAAEWVNCSRVELIRNGIEIKTFLLDGEKEYSNGMRLDTIIRLTPNRDSWYVLVAHGDKDMFPLVGTLDQPSYPSGFTNPVWVKVNEGQSFESLFDAAQNIIKGETGTQDVVRILQDEPDLVPSVLFHLFDSKHSNALAISEGIYDNLSIDHRMMLYRELSKTKMKGGTTLLKKFQTKKNIPYEEITLSSYVNFPIHKSKVDQFKERQKNNLDERLNFLESEFAFIHSGSFVQKAFVGYSENGILPQSWDDIEANRNATFIFAKMGMGSRFLKTKWRMIKDTNLVFYLSGNQDIQIWQNGKKYKKVLANQAMDVLTKFQTIAMKRGANEIVLQVSAQENAEIVFHHAEEKWLIDPSLKLEEVNHIGVNASTNYLTEYNYKYHGNGIALTDGYRGTTDFGNQLWQGWLGENAEVVVDLGKEIEVDQILVGVLESQGSWIFYPRKVEYYTSLNGADFDLAYEESFNDTSSKDGVNIKTIIGKIKPEKTRFIKVVVTPIDQLPDWHKAKGEDAWIFLDEIIIR